MSTAAYSRWAIFADTHGNLASMREALKTGPFDVMVHLGDGIKDAVTVSGEWNIPLIAVSGNEDGTSVYPERRTALLGPFTAILLHGHRLNINPYQSAGTWEHNYTVMDSLMAFSGAQMLLFGHTHIPVIKQTQHGIICNPGSHFIGSQTPHTFAIAEIGSRGIRVCLVRSNNGEWIISAEASLAGTV